jgi:uncharacterized protein
MASLFESVIKNDLAGLQAGLSQGADPNALDEDARSALIHVAIDNKLEAARILLDAHAILDVQDYLGYSALHYAAQDYHPEMVSLLLARGATVDLVDAHGNTPLWRATFNSRGRGSVIEALLKAGADRNHKNKHDSSPVDVAKLVANYNVAQFFA